MDSHLKEKWLDGPNGRIYYFHDDSFKGRPTAVLLHGLSANHTTWLKTRQIWSDLKLNCLMLDLRGHGYSDKTKKRSLYRYGVFTGDLRAVIEKEKLSEVILVGYSFGGFIAIDYALEYPSSLVALILISANHVNPFVYKKIQFLTWPTYLFFNLTALLLRWQRRKKYYYFDQSAERGYWGATWNGFTTMPVSINLWMLSETANLDFRNEIEKISCPTLIIKSSHDIFLSDREAEDMHRKIKLSEVIILNEPTHFLGSRRQNEVALAAVDFLKRKKII